MDTDSVFLSYMILVFIRLGEGFSHGSVVKNLPASERDMGLIPGPGRFTRCRATKAMGNNP